VTVDVAATIGVFVSDGIMVGIGVSDEVAVATI
jgi:hypothetical protein